MIRPSKEISAVLIAGPTASGKSALALRLAERLGGVIVNADSMQVYRGLEILGAQPSEAERRAVPHLLYGHVDPAHDYSVGAWMRDIEPVLADLARDKIPAVIVGGTGLYFRALLGGIDAMPEVPEAVREALRARMSIEGPERLHQELRDADPDAAARIRPTDPQRITRALELVTATGLPLAKIQTGRGVPLIDEGRALKIILRPEREWLRDRIAHRFAAMMEAGALGEAKRFHHGVYVAGTTASKAIGLPELLAHLSGSLQLEESIGRAVTRSRQYAKRQDTWFRHQLDDTWLAPEEGQAQLPL